MSTKIYNAYRIKTLEEAFIIKNDLNDIFKTSVLSELIKCRGKKLGYVFYEQNEIMANCKKYNVSFKWDLDAEFKSLSPVELGELFKKKHSIGYAGDRYNFETSIVLFYDIVTSTKIIQFFGLCRFDWMKPFCRYIENLINQKRLLDFHYQDQTDDDEETGSSDWNDREGIWERILGAHGVPGSSGFSFDFFNGELLIEYWLENLKLCGNEKPSKNSGQSGMEAAGSIRDKKI